MSKKKKEHVTFDKMAVSFERKDFNKLNKVIPVKMKKNYKKKENENGCNECRNKE